VTTFVRKFSRSVGQAQGSWLTLLLLLAVLVPSVCLLWFMSQAVGNERLAIRQKLSEAYLGYLALAQERLENAWIQTAQDLGTGAGELPAPMLFEQQIRAGRADTVVVLDANGRVAYPSHTPPPAERFPVASWAAAEVLESTDPDLAASAYATLARQATNTTLQARALQAQVRCLVRADDVPEALSLLTGPLAAERFRNSTDFQGRYVVPNAQLLTLELLGETRPVQTDALRARLLNRLLDYRDLAMSSPQRRFLMHELHQLAPEKPVSPMLGAEDLAAAYCEAELSQPLGAGITASPLPGVWQFPSANGRVIALYKTETLLSRMRQDTARQPLPEGLRVQCLAPGSSDEGVVASRPAGFTFPGWQLTFLLDDGQLLNTAASQRITGFLWTGVLALATVIALSVLALGMVRRQMALSQLRSDLVANVTHELKTPLSSMRLLVETLLNTPTLEQPKTREYLELIARENVRLSRLIDNFLTFSRIQRNKYTFDFRKAEPGSIADNAAATVRERFKDPGCTFEVRIAPGLPAVIADADALVTVLVNLLDNAWKYSGENKQITLTAAADNGTVQFKVTDNGIGMSPRDAKRIFNRFYRVEPRGSRTGGGCGLGLSIVQLVVTAHRGTVHVESQPDHGSTFTVTIPAKDPDPSRGEP